MTLLYLLAGLGVATAVYLSSASAGGVGRWLQLAGAVVFWPLYLPLVLSYRADAITPELSPPPVDELAQAIDQVDTELAGALRSLDGWAEDVLAREKSRLEDLRVAWAAQATRVREMDRLLCSPEGPQLAAVAGPGTLTQRLESSQEIIRQNRAALRQVRERTYQDLVATLTWVRELVSMIHLAKYTGAPASRAEELVAQIAAAVEGLSVVSATSG